MIFRLLVISGVVCSSLGFGNEDKDSSKVIVNLPNWKPYFYPKDSNKTGFAESIVKTCMKQLNTSYEIMSAPIKRAKVDIQESKIDMNIYSHKAEREEWLHYSKEPLFKTYYKPIVLKDSGVKISSISDFDNYRVGHQLGLSYSKEFYRYVKERKRINIDEARNHILNLKKLMLKRIDVFVYPAASALITANEMGIVDKIQLLDYNIKTSSYFLTIGKASKRIKKPKAFLQKFDSCVAQLKQSEQYCQLAQEHLVPCS